nr:DUF3263 domain-containing protein [Actinopolymorpha singaporensis]
MEPAPKIAAGVSDESSTGSPAESTTDVDSRTASGLCERDQQIISFERQWWKYAGAKEQAIRDQFGMSATRYYQVLNALIDRPEALAFDPLLVKRLRRLRSSRQRARAARRLGVDG